MKHCDICGMNSEHFETYGLLNRPDAKCPNCGSLERHRAMWEYMRDRTDFFDGREKKILHIAPEKFLETAFAPIPGNYVTADLNRDNVTIKMDITNIPYPDDQFDVIICSHVLEHIPDDRKAMRELCRVMNPNGWALLPTPVDRDLKTTYEPIDVTSEQDRINHFGQSDHVRIYGLDLYDRLIEAGFKPLTFREHIIYCVKGE